MIFIYCYFINYY